MFCVFFFFFFFIGVYPGCIGIQHSPVQPVPIVYIGGVCCTCMRHPRQGQIGVRTTTLPIVSRETFPYPSPPLSPTFPLLFLGWDDNPITCYHPPIPTSRQVGLDPRVCVHPTVLPPKKNSCHLIWLSSTSSVVNLK